MTQGLSGVQRRALAIVRQEEQRLESLASRVVKNRHAGGDVVQELRLGILTSNSLPEEEDRLRPYLFKMLVNIARKWRKRNLDSRIEHCESPDTHLDLLEEELLQTSADAELGLVDVDFRKACLRRLAGTLPPQCAAVFNRVFGDGVAQEEVAKEMGISLATVKAHYQRALRKLREMFLPGGKS